MSFKALTSEIMQIMTFSAICPSWRLFFLLSTCYCDYFMCTQTNKVIMNYNEFNAPVTLKQRYFEVIKWHFLCQSSGYFFRETRVEFPCLVMLILNFNLGHERLYDVGSSCFPANRGSYRSSTGILLHQHQVRKIYNLCSNSCGSVIR